MKHPLVSFGCGALLVALSAGTARAEQPLESRLAIEVGGVASSSPLDGVSSMGGTRQINVVLDSNSTMTTTLRPHDGIFAMEVRPTFSLVGGLRIGVGFRSGKAGTYGGGDTFSTPGDVTLLGGDLGIGYQRWFGRFLPYAEVRFGFNAYDITVAPGQHIHQDQLRLDAVVGARFYATTAFYVGASAFGGFGDRYGGGLNVGVDVVRFRNKGVLP